MKGVHMNMAGMVGLTLGLADTILVYLILRSDHHTLKMHTDEQHQAFQQQLLESIKQGNVTLTLDPAASREPYAGPVMQLLNGQMDCDEFSTRYPQNFVIPLVIAAKDSNMEVHAKLSVKELEVIAEAMQHPQADSVAKLALFAASEPINVKYECKTPRQPFAAIRPLTHEGVVAAAREPAIPPSGI